MGRDTVFLKVESRLGYDFSGDIKIGGKYTSLIEHAGLVFI
ncbi:RidA family protein, partial [Acinetobacter baumannii]